MKKISNAIWGIILIAVGALLALKALGIFDFEIFFDGWWTLFIIIPCAIGIFTERDKMGNLIGLCIGLGLLLACRDVFSFKLLWSLVLPIIIIVLGIKLIIGSSHKKDREMAIKYISEQAGDDYAHFSAFGGHELNYNGREFRGAQLTAIFGGIDCDLSGAIIREDVYIDLTAIFGGVDIVLPPDVNVKLTATGIFGGVSDKYRRKNDPSLPTVHITGNCIFGGADIK